MNRRARGTPPKIHPHRYEWWMKRAAYTAPSQTPTMYEKMGVRRQDVEQRMANAQKAERYDRLIEADENGSLIRMTLKEFNRLIRSVELLDFVERNAIQQAKNRQRGKLRAGTGGE